MGNWFLRVVGGSTPACIGSAAAESAARCRRRRTAADDDGPESGKARTLPLLYTRAGHAYAVIASKGGAPEHPLWYLNLRANPAAEITVGSRTIEVRARDAEGEERDRLWRELAELYSGYDKYVLKTTRRIPVVVLEPTAASD